MIEPPPGESELLARCARGNSEAFGTLVGHYQDAVYNVVLRMMNNAEDARDVTQEVFVRAFRGVRSFEGRSSFATWLYSIAMRQCISEYRRRGAAARSGEVGFAALGGEGEDGQFDPPGRGPAPPDGMLSAETRRQVERAVASLSDEYRAVVVLRDIEGLDYSRISHVLACSRGTVKSRLHRARAELRQKLRHLLSRE